jgi:hypothetical protein
LIVCPVSLCDNWRKEFRKWYVRCYSVSTIARTDRQATPRSDHSSGGGWIGITNCLLCETPQSVSDYRTKS